MASISWIDVFLSAVGTMMFFAVMENIMAQYVNERVSEAMATALDSLSSKLFPLFFFFICFLFGALRNQVEVLNVLVQVLLLLFGVVLWVWFFYEVYLCPKLLLRRVLNTGHHGVELNATELRTIFVAIDSEGNRRLRPKQ